ncbi:hypothetical protein CERZMDRAFT_113384 [Cercospora zeae-maydis SCOH1-5]|uniref:CCZ1/INTU/HSP4 first Longin domain-containing protein n=1 Tax=Cercospora zeae-maydis SCOH1-5 TaxID=717836 RepID=A0A6A6FAX1_9PEZI|nr:hypothetical protein CERZMDRAFT_113384 [Cercospora zeae-maydis SCOH1-5]
MSSPPWGSHVVPARLSFLAIYNPSLGLTDDTFKDQAVFYFSRKAHDARLAVKKNGRSDAAGGDALREEENEKLRQIGLAQGMIDFARSFSDREAVDSIDTEKSRIVLHELEAGWWVIASIDLTRLPGVPSTAPEVGRKGSAKAEPKATIEYSGREVSPPALLIQQLIQAHHIFSLHHGPSLTELFVRMHRDKFCNALDRFWTRFCRTWDVLLHGSPATDIFTGIKLSSGGELGMDVGEEDWGSGERDVLEDLVRQMEGLVDVVAARFGEPAPSKEAAVVNDSEALPWMGGGNYPIASDGIIFGGVGAITKPSLRNVSLWMRQIYTYGDHAYGVRDNPLRERRKRIPPPIVSAAGTSLARATRDAQSTTIDPSSNDETTLGVPDQYMKYLTFGISTLVKSNQKRPEPPKRTSTSSSKTMTEQRHAASKVSRQKENMKTGDGSLTQVEPIPDGQTLRTKIDLQKRLEEKGHFVIGLRGDLDDIPDDADAPVEDVEDEESGGLRNVLRSVHVQLSPAALQDEDQTSLQRKMSDAGLPCEVIGWDDFKRHRVLVYVHRPFMYCFLFQHRTPSLAVASFYRDLHRNLLPIHKPLLSSTSYTKVAQRIDNAQAATSDTASITSGQSSNGQAAQPAPIYDLLYDPALLTIHTSIPNIAEPGTPAAEGILTSKKRTPAPTWTRIEALNVHSQVLNTLASVKRNTQEYERTSKTNRGWWVVWMKLPPSTKGVIGAESASETQSDAGIPSPNAAEGADDSTFTPPALPKEDSGGTLLPPSTKQPSTVSRKKPRPMNRIAFLVRKASDTTAPTKSSTSSRAASSMWSALTLRPTAMSDDNTGGAGAGWGPSALAGGIGFDPRKYVEGLLSLNR